MKAIIFGASGLIGSSLATLLEKQNNYNQIILYVRKKNRISGKDIVEKVIDFEVFNIDSDDFIDSDIYCCLGTTIKKVNYNKEAFKKVDLEIPLKIAKASKEFGSKNFLIVSSMGASSTSKFFYNQVKGTLENKLLEMQLSSLHIFRPSLLLGNRNERRLGEKFAQIISPLLSPLLIGQFKAYRPIHADSVAQAMYYVAQKNYTGNHIYDCEQIRKIAQ